jgi:hypothetical protein
VSPEASSRAISLDAFGQTKASDNTVVVIDTQNNETRTARFTDATLAQGPQPTRAPNKLASNDKVADDEISSSPHC